MNKLLLVAISCIMLASCGASHTGLISSTSINRPFQYVDMAYGVSQTNQFFGLGGLAQDALVLEAKRDLMKNRLLKPNEEYTNFTIDFKRTNILFYNQEKVTASADIVRLVNDSTTERYSENYKAKLLSNSFTNPLFSVGDSVMNENMLMGTIVSIEKNQKVRVWITTGDNSHKSRLVSVDEIYTKFKTYNNMKPGDICNLPFSQASFLDSKQGKVVAVGLKAMIVADSTGYTIKVKYAKMH